MHIERTLVTDAFCFKWGKQTNKIGWIEWGNLFMCIIWKYMKICNYMDKCSSRLSLIEFSQSETFWVFCREFRDFFLTCELILSFLPPSEHKNSRHMETHVIWIGNKYKVSIDADGIPPLHIKSNQIMQIDTTVSWKRLVHIPIWLADCITSSLLHFNRKWFNIIAMSRGSMFAVEPAFFTWSRNKDK